ncbi:non-ribosomal peptide synthetase [Streptomyces sp. NPDC002044]|uniref:non-ribosomal peptide synthetase n=1 Tax=Streptomyces sp. NPDC002044 TaxID=3154662 RepID=UPI0033178918
MAAADVTPSGADDGTPSGFPVAGSCPLSGDCATVRRSLPLPAALSGALAGRTAEHLLAASLLLGRKYADATGFRAGVRRAARSGATAVLTARMPSGLTAAAHLEAVAGHLADPAGAAWDAGTEGVEDGEGADGAAAARPMLICVLEEGPAAPGEGTAVPDALTVSAEHTPDGVVLHAATHGHLLDGPAAERALGHLGRLLEGLTGAPEAVIGSLPLVTEAERARLHALRGTRTDYPRDASVHELFAARAAQRPGHPAVIHEGGATLTYRELADRAEALAAVLYARGARRGSRVALLLEKTDRLVVAVLACLRIGAAYVPLTPGLPDLRRDFLLADSGACLLLTEEPQATAPVPVVDLTRPQEAAPGPPAQAAGPLDTAYVMYTSGTTGTPKGVLVNHRAVVRLVTGTDYVDLSADTVVLQTGAVAFDATTFEFWGALLNGGTLVLVPSWSVLEATELRAAVDRHGVNTLWLTSALFNQLVDQDPALLAGCQVLVGGEALSPRHVAAALAAAPTATYVNGYGPTENTTFSVTHRITGPHTDRVPIGRPIANSTAYVLDRDGHPQPVGVAGELHVGGDGLSDGYLGRPELDARAFTTGGTGTPERLYRTGDTARWTEDGLIEYLGRADDQVKIRGYRVELGEIESRITALPEVREAVVLLRPRPDGAPVLCAYVTADSRLDLGSLHAALSRELPEHMVPSGFWQVDAIPLTRNHKADRAALAALEPAATAAAPASAATPASDAATGSPAGPATPGEAADPFVTAVAAVFADVLGVPEVGPEDDFFALGGHSLLAIRVWSRIRSDLGVEFELRQVLDTPTVAGLAASLRRDAPADPGAARPRLVRRSA